MQFYTYFRSSAAYRVRIALNLKQLSVEHVPIHLLKDGGLHHAERYRALNPQELVPTLVLDSGETLTQSLAICEYLDETYPTPPLMPAEPVLRARVRALALAVACDIHPINNLRVLQYLSGALGVGDEQKNTWYRHWVELGLAALETDLARHPATGRFCVGDSPTLADLCLVPQLYNARRFQVDLTPYPTLTRIEANCLALAAFADAAPERQPDAA